MCVMTGCVQINSCMKFTLSVTLQIKLVLKCMVHQINASLQNAEMQEVKMSIYHCHLQTINFMEINWACMEQENWEAPMSNE